MVFSKQRPEFSFKYRLAPYFPGIVLFLITLIITFLTYRDYGISWDETTQREIGRITYDYIFNNSRELFSSHDFYYGSGFEFPLVVLEKLLKLTDSRDIYLMRHLVTNVFFLISALSMYVLVYRIFKNRFIACLGFIMLVFAPRIYAHSFFNTKDIPFLSMFLVTLCYCQVAFEKNKKVMFLILGILCGYTTSIRIMGIMLGCCIMIFLLIDLFFVLKDKGKSKSAILKMVLFSVGFCFTLYITWPALWEHPIHNFIGSFNSFSRFPWHGIVLLNGKVEQGANLPWTYFPTWFLITTPELWLIAGFAGIIMIGINFIKKPLSYLKNSRERNLLLYLMCFSIPIMAVVFLHSVIYNDWRQLYFIYPSFVMMALYFINTLLETRYRFFAGGICILQAVLISCFMVNNYPFSQVYFNNLVAHKEEYLGANYELDYWGCSYKQGLDYILKTDKSKTIKVGGVYDNLVRNNMLLLTKDQRGRIQNVDAGQADYLIMNYKANPNDFPSRKIEYSIKVLNSTILCIYK